MRARIKTNMVASSDPRAYRIVKRNRAASIAAATASMAVFGYYTFFGQLVEIKSQAEYDHLVAAGVQIKGRA